MKIDWINVLERALWTFLEGFLVALPTSISMEMDGAAWKSILIGAAMAGLSAVKTLIIEILRQNKDQ